VIDYDDDDDEAIARPKFRPNHCFYIVIVTRTSRTSHTPRVATVASGETVTSRRDEICLKLFLKLVGDRSSEDFVLFSAYDVTVQNEKKYSHPPSREKECKNASSVVRANPGRRVDASSRRRTPSRASPREARRLRFSSFCPCAETPSVGRLARNKSSPRRVAFRRAHTVTDTSRTSFAWRPMRHPNRTPSSTTSLYSAPTRRRDKPREKTPWIDKSRESIDSYESDSTE